MKGDAENNEQATMRAYCLGLEKGIHTGHRFVIQETAMATIARQG